MFKANLIENNTYYSLRRNQLVITLLMAIPLGLLVNFYSIPLSILIITAGLYTGLLVWMIRNQQQLKQMSGNKIVEFDENEIRIKAKTGQILEIIQLDAVDKIVVKKAYGIPQDNLQDIARELKGNTKANYLIYYLDNRQHKIDFEIDTYFKTDQLNKVIENWKTKDFSIQYL